jgi:hypothetical protein
LMSYDEFILLLHSFLGLFRWKEKKILRKGI